MTMQLWEHWETMSNEDIFNEILIMILITIAIGIVTGFLTYLKNRYKDRVNESNSKILKFIFNNIL